mgnify:CR=1 FL=1
MKEKEREFGTKANESPAVGRSAPVASEVEDSRVEKASAPPPNGTHTTAPGTCRRRLCPPWAGGLAGAAVTVAAGAGVWFVASRVVTLPAESGSWRQWLQPGLAGALTLSLASLAAWAVSGMLDQWNQERQRLCDLLERIAALDPDSDKGWADPMLKTEPELAQLVGSLHVRDRRQRAELARAAVAEGEMARLGTSLMSRERDCVAASFETPVVGRAAASAASLYEEIDQLRQAQAQLEERLATLGAQLAGAAAETRRWNGQAGREVIGRQSDLQRLAGETQRLVKQAADRRHELEEAARGGLPTLADVSRCLPASGGQSPTAILVQTAHLLKDLVARGGSLAIQTALEVTRLGDRGETLFPLTESLKSLIAEFQGVATRIEKLARDEEAVSAALDKARSLMGQIEQATRQREPESQCWQRTAGQLGDLKLSLVRVGMNLADVAHGFVAQGARLEELAGTASELTGVPLEKVEDAELPEVTPFAADEFASPQEAAPGASEPPPAPTPPLFAADESAPAATARAPRFASSLFESEGRVTEQRPAASRAPKPWLDDAEQAGTPAASATAGALPDEEERIYDLTELGAVALEEPDKTGDPEAGRIYDLAEFGAVALA